MLDSISPKNGGWIKTFFIVVLMIGFILRVYSNCLVAPGEEPLPTSSSFNIGALDDHLVVGFLRGIFPATYNKILETM
jgi:hypothetical protein